MNAKGSFALRKFNFRKDGCKMLENNKLNQMETEKVSGGKGNSKELKSNSPRVVDPGDLDRCPTIEYTCPKCGCKYTHRNPGTPFNCSATAARCPNCGI